MTNLATRILLAVISVASLSAFTACSRDTKTPDGYTPPTQCQLDDTCDAGQGGSMPDGSMAGAGGGGAGGTGGRDGGAGTGGGGMGGVGGSDACEPDCTDPAPICDEAIERCVQCTGDAHCEDSEDGPVCVDGTCTECAEAQDCLDQDAGAACVDNQCVECSDDTHCTEPGASHCDTGSHQCVSCQTSSQCAGITDGDAELDICAEGQCVQCTANDTAACGADDGGAAYVCDVQQGRCSTQTVESRGLCVSCVSDAACEAGTRCVRQRFDGQQLGYVCLWEVGAEEGGAPSDCSEARPYVNPRTDVETIEGEEVDVCGLRKTTCKAINEDFSAADCDGPEDDAACGMADQDDALCREFTPDADLCTVPCSSSRDCKVDHACNVNEQPNYCDLQTGTCYSENDCPEGQTCVDKQCEQS